MTYKIKWPASPHALYVTINDIERDGRRRPFEIFINTKNLEHFAWTVALTRMISAVFRRGGDVTFVAEELKAVFDPEGGRWMGGRYVPSLLAAIGDVIEEHMIRIGFLVPEHVAVPDQDGDLKAVGSQPGIEGRTRGEHTVLHTGRADTARTGAAAALPGGLFARPSSGPSAGMGAKICPRCGNRSLNRVEGCWTCATCHYSHCG